MEAKRKQQSTHSNHFSARVMEGFLQLRKQYSSESAMARAVGISQPTINKILSNKQEPRLEAIAKVMAASGAELHYPWDSKTQKNQSQERVGLHAEHRTVLTVNRFHVASGTVVISDSIGLYLSSHILSRLQCSSAIGVYAASQCAFLPAHEISLGDDLLIDFLQEPSERTGTFLICFNKQHVGCLRIAKKDMENFQVPPNISFRMVAEENFVPFEWCVLGKVLYISRAVID